MGTSGSESGAVCQWVLGQAKRERLPPIEVRKVAALVGGEAEAEKVGQGRRVQVGECGFGNKKGAIFRGNFRSEVLQQVKEARSAKRREEAPKAGLLPRRPKLRRWSGRFPEVRNGVKQRSTNEKKETLVAAIGADGGRREGKARVLCGTFGRPLCPPRHRLGCCLGLGSPYVLGFGPPVSSAWVGRVRCCPVLARPYVLGFGPH